MYYIIALMAAQSVGARFILELIHENSIETMKEVMDYERETAPKRTNVLKGLFRVHNERFKRDGFSGPKGTA